VPGARGVRHFAAEADEPAHFSKIHRAGTINIKFLFEDDIQNTGYTDKKALLSALQGYFDKFKRAVQPESKRRARPERVRDSGGAEPELGNHKHDEGVDSELPHFR